jgi:hypothetical protein
MKFNIVLLLHKIELLAFIDTGRKLVGYITLQPWSDYTPCIKAAQGRISRLPWSNLNHDSDVKRPKKSPRTTVVGLRLLRVGYIRTGYSLFGVRFSPFREV